jgi:hypothetical protein
MHNGTHAHIETRAGLSFKDLLYVKAKSVPVGFVYNEKEAVMGAPRHYGEGKAKVTKLDKTEEPKASPRV